MKNKIFLYIEILAIIGISLALFLLWEQFFHPSIQPCNINSTVNCDAIISGVVSKTLGLPTPLYGLIGYVVMFFASLYRKRNLLLGMATFGLLFCFWIGYKELFELHTICPVCLGCEAVIISIFFLAIFVLKKKNGEDK